MAVLSYLGYRPTAEQWLLSDINSFPSLGQMLANELEAAPSPRSEERFANWLSASELWQLGVDIWYIHDENTLAFASEPRFVKEAELELDLDELVSDGAYILSAERSDKDLSDPDILEVISTELRLSGLAVLHDSKILYDSFACEEEFSSRIVCAIERWDIEQEL